MGITETQAKSILRKHKRIDSWFLSRYNMNLYRGCVHGCAYCDGRSENYYVEGDFDQDIQVKINAPEVLTRELDPARKRTPFKPGFIMLGGGVSDSYQPLETHYQITRKILERISQHSFPVHILTKSTLIKRDLDLIRAINQKTRAMVSFSFSSVDAEISARFEPHVPPPLERLAVLADFKKQGIACGMVLMPVLPFLTDTPGQIAAAVQKGAEAGVDFILFGGMTMKSGKQKAHFFKSLQNHFPKLAVECEMIYRDDKWGRAVSEYHHHIHAVFFEIMKRFKIPKRIPPRLFRDFLDENDRVMVILEHLDYLFKAGNQPNPYGYAAYSISQINTPLSEMRNKLHQIKGVGGKTADLIKEILDTGTCGYYECLI